MLETAVQRLGSATKDTAAVIASEVKPVGTLANISAGAGSQGAFQPH